MRLEQCDDAGDERDQGRARQQAERPAASARLDCAPAALRMLERVSQRAHPAMIASGRKQGISGGTASGHGGTPLLVRVNMTLSRVLVSIAAVTIVTGAIFGLKEVAPVLSLGVLYIL